MQQQTAESKSTGGRRQTLPPALLECLKATAPPRAAEACALEELKEHRTFDSKKLLKRGLKMGTALIESCAHLRSQQLPTTSARAACSLSSDEPCGIFRRDPVGLTELVLHA